MMTILEVAEEMRVSRPTVQSWIDKGELAAIDVAPAGSRYRMYRVADTALEDFKRRRIKTARIAPDNIPDYVG